jgi:hypothetical protein
MGFVVIVVVVFVVVVMQIGIARLRQLVAGSARRTGRVGWKMAAARSKVMMIHSRAYIRTAATEASGEEEVPGEDVDMYVLGGMSSVGWLVREGGRTG